MKTKSMETFQCLVTSERVNGDMSVVVVFGPGVPWNSNSRLQFTLEDARALRDSLTSILGVLEQGCVR